MQLITSDLASSVSPPTVLHVYKVTGGKGIVRFEAFCLALLQVWGGSISPILQMEGKGNGKGTGRESKGKAKERRIEIETSMFAGRKRGILAIRQFCNQGMGLLFRILGGYLWAKLLRCHSMTGPKK